MSEEGDVVLSWRSPIHKSLKQTQRDVLCDYVNTYREKVIQLPERNMSVKRHFTENNSDVKQIRSSFPFSFFSSPSMPDGGLSRLSFKDKKNLKPVKELKVYFYICFLWCENKPCLKLVDCTSTFWFRLSQMCLFGGWLPHKALQSVCKRISRFCFFLHFPSVDKWTSHPGVSSYLLGEGLPGLLYIKMEHIWWV